MDWNKLKFTKLDDEIVAFLFKNPTTLFMGKEIADKLKVSQTAVANSTQRLSKLGIVIKEKKVILSIKLNREDRDIFSLKKVYNIKSIYSSGIIKKLSADFPGSTIILFGSYSYGEDTEESDLDLAIIGYRESKINLEEFEKRLDKKIQLHFFKNISKIQGNLKDNIINGVVFAGAIKI